MHITIGSLVMVKGKWGNLVDLQSAALLGGADKIPGVRPGQYFNWRGRTLRYWDTGPKGAYDKRGHWHKYGPRIDIYDKYNRLNTGYDPYPKKMGLSASVGGESGDNIINYSPVYHMNGSSEEMKRYIADSHRKHIDQLREDLGEVIWRNKRSSFTSSSGFA
jgi:hypothetical protein